MGAVFAVAIFLFLFIIIFKIRSSEGKTYKIGSLTYDASGSPVKSGGSSSVEAIQRRHAERAGRSSTTPAGAKTTGVDLEAWQTLTNGYLPPILFYALLCAATGPALVAAQSIAEIPAWWLARFTSAASPGILALVPAWMVSGLVLGALCGVSVALIATRRARFGHPLWILTISAVALGVGFVNDRYTPLLANALAVRGASTDVEWIAIPPGEFKMGSDQVSESPIHRVELDGFEMAKTEVTVAQYRACVGAGACSVPVSYDLRCNWNKVGRDDYPIDCVTHDQAKAYAKFVGGRLPSEAEWEYAARSGGNANIYPWAGGNPDRMHVVMQGDCEGCSWLGSLPVCSRPAGNSLQQLCDMAGNVFEWVEDSFVEGYSGAPVDGSARLVEGLDRHVVRGGGWDSTPEALRVTARATTDPKVSYAGFRPVRDVPGTFVITASQDDDSPGNCEASFPDSPESPAQKTPATFTAMKGEHRVLVTCDKGKREQRVRLRAGEKKEVSFTIVTDPSKLVTWVQVPAGSYRMGSWWGQKDERPVHEVALSGFEIATTEVTVEQYVACAESGGCPAPGTGEGCNGQKTDGANLPINCVNWESAQAFSRWVGGRLPTETEWEYAARDTGAKQRYPWGDNDPTCAFLVMKDAKGNGCGSGGTLPVCSRRAGNNLLDLCDMGGNVWEWVADWYAEDAYRRAEPTDPTGPADGTNRVLRGGAYSTDRVDAFKGTFRFYASPTDRWPWFGFRPVRPLTTP